MSSDALERLITFTAQYSQPLARRGPVYERVLSQAEPDAVRWFALQLAREHGGAFDDALASLLEEDPALARAVRRLHKQGISIWEG